MLSFKQRACIKPYRINGSIPMSEPMNYRLMYGQYSTNQQRTSFTFVSKHAYDKDIQRTLGVKCLVCPVQGIRNLTKEDMKNNDAMPKIEVDPRTYDVMIDGEALKGEVATELPLAQRYFLF
ncbi:hypothetical protein DOS77_10640 [Staphylococcus felis]|nr:hypothetical protein [Staphylococcus felis]REI20135.1 hypothetical protein DOS77_10640 [Staphylococcus felis]